MQEEWWESPVCHLCNFWWLFLLLLLGGLTAFFARDVWLPTPVPTPTATLSPTSTPVPSPTLPSAPTATLEPSPVPTPTRVQALGTGDVQVTLIWNSVNDLDLWVYDPENTQIYYGNKTSSSGGELDVDANPGCQNLTSQPVENIFWPLGEAPTGNYVVSVNFFSSCSTISSTPFTVQILVDGIVQEFSGVVSAVGETVEIYRFER